jgi:hypothetical protein
LSKPRGRVAKKTAMMTKENFAAFVTKVNMYLDNELSDKESRDLLKEIQANPYFLSILSKEKSFKEFIKSKLERRQPSPALIQSIKEKIKVNA